MRILWISAVFALSITVAPSTPPPVSFVSPQSPIVQTEPYSSTVGDFNRDGILDIAVTNYASNSVSLLFGRGNGTFWPAIEMAAGVTPTGIVASDLNGDQ